MTQEVLAEVGRNHRKVDRLRAHQVVVLAAVAAVELHLEELAQELLLACHLWERRLRAEGKATRLVKTAMPRLRT